MASYEVIVLGVQGANNKVYGPGAKVTEAHFPEGNAEKLCKEGKLKKLTSDKVSKKALQKIVDEAKKVLDAAKKELESATEETKEALQAEFDKAQVAFDEANKNLENA